MKPSRILIIEDEAITVSALKRELAKMGYEVAGTAMSAQEAVFAAEETKPDLVLMDITLADEYDGVVAATAIRGNLGLPVIFLTAHADDATMKRAIQAGPFGYVIKPFTTPELKAAIEVALHKHQSEIDSRSAASGA
jgi:hypothetical protein